MCKVLLVMLVVVVVDGGGQCIDEIRLLTAKTSLKDFDEKQRPAKIDEK